MSGLLSRLVYSAEDERLKRPPRHKVFMPAGVNIRNGTASLASAIRLYLEFAEDRGEHKDKDKVLLPLPPPQPRRPTADWPTWDIPNDDLVLEMARISARYIRFLHPDIVRAIVDDVELNRVRWEARLQDLRIDPRVYLWERSACAFPGIRRYAGRLEISQFGDRGKNRPADALALDDNSYPKQIWSFIFRGKRFANFGPPGYALAHLADHKEYQNRGVVEFVGTPHRLLAVPGLYTSAANAAFMPTALIHRPDSSL